MPKSSIASVMPMASSCWSTERARCGSPTIIDLAHNLNLSAVAEGVEDQAVLDRLDELGCDVAQGYFVSRPLTSDTLETWARERVTAELGLVRVAA